MLNFAMLTLLLAAGLALSQPPAGQIAFIQGVRDESRRVALLDAQTGDIRVIGDGPWDGAPVWSHDGSQFAYEQTADDGSAQIRIARPDGTVGQPLVHETPMNRAPSWSPDGTKLAYSSGTGRARRIRVFDLATSKESEWGKRTDAEELKLEIAFLTPVWVSDDDVVSVGVREDEAGRTSDLYELEREGVTPLVDTRGGGNYVEWMPATHAIKSMLAYESNDGGDREIFVAATGRGVMDVSNHRASDWNPVWSADGEWLAFESYRGGSRGIFKVRPQQTIVTPIVAEAASDSWSPTWSPDGAWIAFVSTRAGKPALYACRTDGSETRALTNHDSDDLAPAWRPATTK